MPGAASVAIQIGADSELGDAVAIEIAERGGGGAEEVLLIELVDDQQ